MKNQLSALEHITKITVDEDQDLFYDISKMAGLQQTIVPKAIQPLYHSSDINCRLRADRIGDCLTNDQVFSNTSAQQSDYFASTRIITDHGQ